MSRAIPLLLFIVAIILASSSMMTSAKPLRSLSAGSYNCTNPNPSSTPVECPNKATCCQAEGVNHESLCISTGESCCQYIGAVAACKTGQPCCGWGDDDAVSRAFCCEADGGFCTGGEWGTCCKKGQIQCGGDGFATCCDPSVSVCGPNGGCVAIPPVTTTPANPNGKKPGTLLWELMDPLPESLLSPSRVVNVTLLDGKSYFVYHGNNAIYARDPETGNSVAKTFVGGDMKNPPSISNCAQFIYDLYTNTQPTSARFAALVAFTAQGKDGNFSFGILDYNAPSSSSKLVYQDTLANIVAKAPAAIFGNYRDFRFSLYKKAIFVNNYLVLQICGLSNSPGSTDLVCWAYVMDAASRQYVAAVNLYVQAKDMIIDTQSQLLIIIDSEISSVVAISTQAWTQNWQVSIPKYETARTATISQLKGFEIGTGQTLLNSSGKGDTARQLFVATTYSVGCIEISTGVMLWSAGTATSFPNWKDSSVVITSAIILWETQLVVYTLKKIPRFTFYSTAKTFVYYLYLPLGHPENGGKTPGNVAPPCARNPYELQTELVSLGNIGSQEGFPVFLLGCKIQPGIENKNYVTSSYFFATQQIRVTSFEQMWNHQYINATIISDGFRVAPSTANNGKPLLTIVTGTIDQAVPSATKSFVGIDSETGVVQYSIALEKLIKSSNFIQDSFLINFVGNDIAVVFDVNTQRFFGIRL